MIEIAPEDRRLTLVIAAFNEAEALPRLQPRIRTALDMAEAEGLQAHRHAVAIRRARAGSTPA